MTHKGLGHPNLSPERSTLSPTHQSEVERLGPLQSEMLLLTSTARRLHALHTVKVGAYGTHNALGLGKHKRARFLLASTSEVYGDPLVHPQPETYWGNVNPIGPRGVYVFFQAEDGIRDVAVTGVQTCALPI